jgi:folate-dependent tRNA-U54 methylase TrmFO/GidA
MSSEDTLSVAVENSHTLQKYSQSINREYISQQDTFFQSVFEEALDIYDYLRTIINEIVIEGELLLFDYRYGKSKVKRISIQLLKEDIDPVEQAHLRAEKMREHFTAQLFQKDVEIKELQQKYE